MPHSDDSSRKPVTDKEAILAAKVEELRRQVEERKRRQAELEAAIARFPSREEIARTHEEVQANLEHTRKELENTIEQIEPLREPEERAYQLCARLHKLESYCQKAEDWAENVLRKNVEDDIAQEQQQSEADVAAYIEQLQQRREESLEKLIALRDRVRTRAADLRRGHHRDPMKKESGAFELVNTTQVNNMERSASPRPQDFEEIDDNTYEISVFNDQLNDELNTLQARLRRLQKTRSRYQRELMMYKSDSKKDIASLENSIRQTEQRIARDQRLIQQLHASNGALVSTLQMVMSQLNVEHYGTLLGPTAIENATKRQEAIMEKQSARAGSAMVPRITDRQTTSN